MGTDTNKNTDRDTTGTSSTSTTATTAGAAGVSSTGADTPSSGNSSSTGNPPPPSRPSGSLTGGEPKRVEVLVDNLGPQRLMKGYITSDPVIVALLDTQDEVELVREVKDKC